MINKYKLYSIATLDFNKSNIDKNAIFICKRLQDNGFKAYLVGGCVRDLFMNIIPKDWDIATNASVEQSKALFDKTFDSGIDFGTITVIMGPLPKDQYEITTFRTETDYSDGRRPDSVIFVNDIEDDLSRRDLTINAMAYDPINDKIIDPFGGVEDLQSKTIKAVGDPNKRFSEDGLRTMRVARFAARFGFDVDKNTEHAISNNLDVLDKVSKERMKDELLKTLSTSSPSIGLKILYDTKALDLLGEAFKHIDTNIFTAIDNCKCDIETKLAVLLYNSPNLIESNLRFLKFSNQEIKKILFLFKSLKEFNKFIINPNAIEARKFLSFIKTIAPDSIENSLQQFFEFCKSINISQALHFKEFLLEPIILLKDLKISTPDLIKELNLTGYDIKKVLTTLHEKVLEDPSLNTKEKLLEIAKRN